MAIKIKRQQLEQIVLEELTRFLHEQLNEAGPGRGTVLDDEDQAPVGDEDVDTIPNPGEAPEEALPTDSPVGDGMSGDDPGEVPELQGGDEDVDADLDALEAGEEPPSEEEQGTVAGELSGKTIESISVDEDSKIMPGATEVILTFHESPDAFRLLVTKTGQVKYFYRGLHNTLEAEVAPMPGDDAPEEPGDEMGAPEDMPPEEGGDEFEEMPPLGDEDMPPEPPPEEEPV